VDDDDADADDVVVVVEEHDSVGVGGTRNLEHENLILLN
jgi:hypothetical protein